ncbi:hypothetical protein NL526_29600, partial [Klebsiella pneumoniae]|nr:hypothetical protein [Klebsiella pneumoniae]
MQSRIPRPVAQQPTSVRTRENRELTALIAQVAWLTAKSEAQSGELASATAKKLDAQSGELARAKAERQRFVLCL